MHALPHSHLDWKEVAYKKRLSVLWILSPNALRIHTEMSCLSKRHIKMSITRASNRMTAAPINLRGLIGAIKKIAHNGLSAVVGFVYTKDARVHGFKCVLQRWSEVFLWMHRHNAHSFTVHSFMRFIWFLKCFADVWRYKKEHHTINSRARETICHECTVKLPIFFSF